MSNIFETLSADDEKSLRKGLIFLSASSIVFDSINFVENILKIFVIEIVFEREQISTLIDYAIIILLVSYLIVSVPIWLGQLHDIHKRRVRTQKERAENKLFQELGPFDHLEHDESPEGYSRRLEKDYERRLESIDTLYEVYVLIFLALKTYIVNFSIPLVITAYALSFA